MTQDEIISMAEEAGLPMSTGPSGRPGLKALWGSELERFAALVEAKEREACAQICDTTYYQFIGPEFGEVRHGIAACAAAIRARSTT